MKEKGRMDEEWKAGINKRKKKSIREKVRGVFSFDYSAMIFKFICDKTSLSRSVHAGMISR